MHTKDTPTPAELRNPDLSRMYKEVIKLRLQVRQAEAEAHSRNAASDAVTGVGQGAPRRDRKSRPFPLLRRGRTGRARARPTVWFQFRWFPP